MAMKSCPLGSSASIENAGMAAADSVAIRKLLSGVAFVGEGAGAAGAIVGDGAGGAGGPMVKVRELDVSDGAAAAAYGTVWKDERDVTEGATSSSLIASLISAQKVAASSCEGLRASASASPKADAPPHEAGYSSAITI
jgi:hypothetical protein